MVDGENPQVKDIPPRACDGLTPQESPPPEESEAFVESIFDMKGITESPMLQPTSPIKFITPMKLQRSPRITTQEVNVMFAAQQNELTRLLNQVFIAQSQESSRHTEMSGTTTLEVEQEEGEILEQFEGEVLMGSSNDEDIVPSGGSSSDEPARPLAVATAPPIPKQIAPSSPKQPSNSTVPSPPQRRTQEVMRSLFPPETIPTPPPPEQRPPIVPSSPMDVESESGHDNRAETPPSPTPDRRRATRRGKQPQPRQPTPPPTVPARPKVKLTKDKGGSTSRKSDKTDQTNRTEKTNKQLKWVLYGTLSGAVYNNPNFLATCPTPVSPDFVCFLFGI